MTSKIEVSHRTIIFTVLFLAGSWLVLQIRDILFLVFISFIIMSGLRPLVDALEVRRIPRVLSILIIYALVIGFITISFAGTIPSLIIQSGRLITELPGVISRAVPQWSTDAAAITQQIAPISENIFRVTVEVFSNIVTTITVLVLSFYLLLERRQTETLSAGIMGAEASERMFTIVRRVEERLGAWVRGQILLMTVIGILTYGGLTFLHMDYVLPLSILAGLLEIVPMIGPIVSAIPAVLVAYAISPFLALTVAALYFLIQQLENHVVVPVVMRRSVGLSPFVTIVLLMIGARLAGITGAILAIPAFLVLQVGIGEVINKKD